MACEPHDKARDGGAFSGKKESKFPGTAQK
jgi:hypothetical protein